MNSNLKLAQLRAAVSTTIQPKEITLAETYREELKRLAGSIDVNANVMLDMLSENEDGVRLLLNRHHLYPWLNTANPAGERISLIALTKSNGHWFMSFKCVKTEAHAGTYRLHDMDIADVLTFIDSVEAILSRSWKKSLPN